MNDQLLEWIKVLLPLIVTLSLGTPAIYLMRGQQKKLAAEIEALQIARSKTRSEVMREDAETAQIYQQMVGEEAERALQKSKTLSDMQTKINILNNVILEERVARKQLELSIADLKNQLEKEREARLTAQAELERLKEFSDNRSKDQTDEICLLSERVRILEDILTKNNIPIPKGKDC